MSKHLWIAFTVMLGVQQAARALEIPLHPTEAHGLKIGGANEVIRAVLLSASEAKHLQTTAKSPALEVVSVGYLEDDSPLWWERTLYRGDQYEFQSRLGPIQSATPARGTLR